MKRIELINPKRKKANFLIHKKEMFLQFGIRYVGR